MTELALTLDDAPSVDRPGVPVDLDRMDRMREILQRWNVEQCVAFVVGVHCEQDDGALRRWLDAGYELGNHSYAHEPSSGLSVEQFRDSLARCDRVLERAGAFEAGRPRWFRFPQLDRGRDAQHRGALNQELAASGYREAPASFDSLDCHYEEVWASANTTGPGDATTLVEQRFLDACYRNLERANASAAREAPPLPLVAYAHFGPVAEHSLAAILHLLRVRNIRLCSLESALEHPLYQRFTRDMHQNGMCLYSKDDGALKRRIGRRLWAASLRLGLWKQRRLGPVHPA